MLNLGCADLARTKLNTLQHRANRMREQRLQGRCHRQMEQQQTTSPNSKPCKFLSTKGDLPHPNLSHHVSRSLQLASCSLLDLTRVLLPAKAFKDFQQEDLLLMDQKCQVHCQAPVSLASFRCCKLPLCLWGSEVAKCKSVASKKPCGIRLQIGMEVQTTSVRESTIQCFPFFMLQHEVSRFQAFSTILVKS